MSRSLRFELTAKNVFLLVAALGAFGTAVGLATYFGHAGHTEEQQGDHGEEGEHGAEGEHGEEGEHGDEVIKLSAAALKNANIEVGTAGPAQVNVTISLPGEVALNQDKLAHVTPRVSGTALEVRKQLGAVVKKGEVLAVLQSGDLAETQRNFLATKERLALAESNFARAELLQKDNVSSQKEYLEARQALAEANIEYRGASQQLQAIGGATSGSGKYSLVAPFDGTIIEKHIGVGEVLSNETRAFIVADLSKIWVNVTVYAMDLARVRVGQSAEVRGEGIASPAYGTIAYLGQVLGEETRSAVARVVLDNPGPEWRPGLFATAEVSVEQGGAAVTVNDEAIQTIEGKDVVFVEKDGGFEPRAVTLGRRGSAHVVEVVDGLKAGERYVSKNSFILKAELGKSEAGHEH